MTRQVPTLSKASRPYANAPSSGAFAVTASLWSAASVGARSSEVRPPPMKLGVNSAIVEAIGSAV